MTYHSYSAFPVADPVVLTVSAVNGSFKKMRMRDLSVIITLCELLLDEESAQIAQLPGASNTQHSQLDQRPPHHPPVHALALIPEFCFPLSLEHLLSPDILQSRVEVLNLVDNLTHLLLVAALNLTRLANSHVELELDAAYLATAEEEARCGRYVRRREAELVVAGIGRAESEFAGA